jgi:hypothetical protein
MDAALVTTRDHHRVVRVTDRAASQIFGQWEPDEKKLKLSKHAKFIAFVPSVDLTPHCGVAIVHRSCTAASPWGSTGRAWGIARTLVPQRSDRASEIFTAPTASDHGASTGSWLSVL